VLHAVIGPVTALLGPDHPRVLTLCAQRAAILLLGGDTHRALPEFDTLYAAYARTEGPDGELAMDCQRQAAYCRTDLGHAKTALEQFRRVLAHVGAASGDATDTVIDLRRNIGMPLVAEGRHTEAEAALRPLYEDMCVVFGPHHEDTEHVAALLIRLSRPTGSAPCFSRRPGAPPRRPAQPKAFRLVADLR